MLRKNWANYKARKKQANQKRVHISLRSSGILNIFIFLRGPEVAELRFRLRFFFLFVFGSVGADAHASRRGVTFTLR